jgi:hypothetical protein
LFVFLPHYYSTTGSISNVVSIITTTYPLYENEIGSGSDTCVDEMEEDYVILIDNVTDESGCESETVKKIDGVF